MINNYDEMEFLESVTSTYITSENEQDKNIKTFAINTFSPYLYKNSQALEFGCCDGFMSELIASKVETLTIVDGSKIFIEMAKKRGIKNAIFIHSLFEDFSTEVRYDYIFATYILEHIQDPISFLTHAKNLLKPDGIIFIVVPNARAFSRQLARHMGIIDDLYDLTTNDINHGHRRVYDRTLLSREIESAGLQQISQGGLFFKILADFQMDLLIREKILAQEHLEGLYRIGLEYPDLAGSLYSICKKI